jgi:hypothetical protein
MEPVFIRKVKRGRGHGLWGSYVADADEAGLWLFTPEQSLYRGTDGLDVSVCFAGWPDPPGRPVIHLIPHEGWWFARWQDTPQGAHVSIDICTPCRFVDGFWSYDDLELDLMKFTDGTYRVVDRDELDEAVRAGHVSDDELRTCLETASMLESRLAAGDDLFDVRGWRVLERCVAEPYEPITDLPD